MNPFSGYWSSKSPQSIVVLVVEDDALVRLGIVDALEDDGFVVFEAASAVEAMRLLSEDHAIQLMFTDVDMPGEMDGLALTSAVCQRWPAIRTMVTSGMCGMSGSMVPPPAVYVPKPYNPDAVMRSMRDLMVP